MTQTATSISDQIRAVNRLLEVGEPTNISVDDYSHHTGYKPQYIVDAMNEVFGWGNWGFEEISNEIMGDEKATLVISQMRVFLKDCAFQPTGWGQARITKGDTGDARKGAQTDALKKALSYFSIGNRAYQGLLIGKEDGKANQNGKPNNRPSQNSTAPKAVPQNGNAPKLVLKWSDVYQKGAAKGVWTKEDFYPKASAILNGDPVNGNNVKSLSQEQLQKLHDEIEKPKAASIAS